MSFETVDVFLHAGTEDGDPVANVVVKVLSQDGRILFTMGISDSSGRASFLLESGYTYQLRFYKFQVMFQQPLLVTIEEAPATNTFDVVCTPFVPPVTADPRLCVAFGWFKTPTLAVARGVDIQFIAKFDPLLVDERVVLKERAIIKTDKDGYAQINLIRCGKYSVTVAGFEDVEREIEVPDLPNVNIGALLFPIVKSVSFVPAPSPGYALTVGGSLRITPTVRTSTGATLSGVGKPDVRWRSEDDTILSIDASCSEIILYGRAVGTTHLLCERSDKSIIVIPDTGIEGQPVDVTVS